MYRRMLLFAELPSRLAVSGTPPGPRLMSVLSLVHLRNLLEREVTTGRAEVPLLIRQLRTTMLFPQLCWNAEACRSRSLLLREVPEGKPGIEAATILALCVLLVTTMPPEGATIQH